MSADSAPDTDGVVLRAGTEGRPEASDAEPSRERLPAVTVELARRSTRDRPFVLDASTENVTTLATGDGLTNAVLQPNGEQ